jgi:hypothetical protein
LATNAILVQLLQF